MSEKIIIPAQKPQTLKDVIGHPVLQRMPNGTFNLLVDSAGQVSDGYHTFDELYNHRHILFCALSSTGDHYVHSWKSLQHWIDGKLEIVWDGWFLAGINLGGDLQGKMITYHLPLSYWNLFEGNEVHEPLAHDGHTSKDVLERIREFLTL